MSNRQFETEAPATITSHRVQQIAAPDNEIITAADDARRLPAEWRAGSTPRPEADAAALTRASGGRLARAGHALLQLQRDYGNRYVQRVVGHTRQADSGAQRETRPDDEELLRRGVDSTGGHAVSCNRTGMPDQLKAGIESLSGISLDHVTVHYNSSQPAQIDALAYAQGSDIHVAPGQEQHLPHEAWHVVQQAQGRVQATMETQDGVPVNDDQGLEHEARVMGARASSSQINRASKAQREAVDVSWRKVREGSISTVQRLPTPRVVRSAIGPEEDERSWGLNTEARGLFRLMPRQQLTAYGDVLNALDLFNQYVLGPVGTTRDKVLSQLKVVLQLFDNVITACASLEQQDDELKADYFLRLKLQAQNEKGAAIAEMVRYANSPASLASGRLGEAKRSVQAVLGTTMFADSVVMKEDFYTGDVGGGTNTLNVFTAGQSDYFFKPNQEALDVFADAVEENEELEKAGMLTDALRAKQNRTNLSAEIGIDVHDARTAAREVAESRLDAMLGAGLIARTQFALRKVGQAPSQLGSVQKGAKGRAAGAWDIQKPVLDDTEKAQVGQGAYLARDPALARQLSILEVLDAIAGQQDRNMGNFYIALDAQGSVIDVTGIDLDVSWGTAEDLTPRGGYRIGTFPGLSQFIDKDMATRVIDIDLGLLRLTLSDLLTGKEYAAALKRLASLQAHLEDLQANDQLLEPAQWNAAVMRMGAFSNTYQRLIQQWAELDPRDRGY